MRIGILVGACGLAVAAATSADVVNNTTAVTENISGRSVDAMHRAIGAPGSMMREQIVDDLRDRVERGEISPYKVLLSDALPEWKIAVVGENGPLRTLGGTVNFNSSGSRGVVSTFDDTFSTYPLSTDPIFARNQVAMQDQVNPSGETWNFSQAWYIPSLFVAGQMDPDKIGVADPLPRWQGAELTENASLGVLISDINGDGLVNTADLGILLGKFGAKIGDPTSPPDPIYTPGPDLNSDGKVDTADLGILLGQFGFVSGDLFCTYTVDVVQTTIPDGGALDPGTIAAGPVITQTIAVLNKGTYSNDVDLDGCPDCTFFNILTDGAVSGELVYGDWTLTDPIAPNTSLADIKADVTADTCSGYGTEAVLADARGETAISETVCCFLGARTTYPLFAPVTGSELRMEIDCFYTTLDTFQWVDSTSSVEGFTVTRTFMGGIVDGDFLKFSSDGSGFQNHFVFLGNLPGNFQFGQFYGTVADPLVGNDPVFIPTGRWFSLSYRLTTGDVSIWLLDETQYVSNGWVDPDPLTDGSETPGDGSDDIDTQGADHWFKIFPTGPAGPSPGAGDGQLPDIPQAPLAAVSSDTFRFLWAGDPTNVQVPNYVPHNIFYDNIHIEGVLFPVPDLPKFALNYTDDMENYFGGANLALMGGRWFDALSSRAVVDSGISVSGNQSLRQNGTQKDGQYRNEFETDLPLASSVSATWTASVEVALSATGTIRGIRLGDDTIQNNDNSATVARILTGVSDENGNTVTEPGPIPVAGSTRIYMRTVNPAFDPNTEAEARDLEFEPPAIAINSEFINVPTDIFWEDINVFHNFSFEVDAAQTLVVRRDGTIVNPQAGGTWTANSTGVDEMSFESNNSSFASDIFGDAIWVDDVILNGFGITIVDGPLFDLPYVDGFTDYPVDTPIDGQGDTPFVDGATLVDTNLCIEQGLQALNLAPVDPSPLKIYCAYSIKNDAIGGIDPVNDYGLANGGTIWVEQADCGLGAILCKDLQCFTNPNRPGEFFPNVGLFDPAEIKAAVGARVALTGTTTGDLVALATNGMDTFTWDTYDPANVFCKYVVNTIADADEDLAGQQNIATPLPVGGNAAVNVPYYTSIGGKIILGSTIAVDQIFDVDPMTGFATCPGVIDVENLFKIVDPCEIEILTGTWTYVGDGLGVDQAMPLVCGTDTVHFNFVFDGFPRYNGGLGGTILVVDDPTATGRGNVLQVINNGGFVTDGGSLFIDLRSTYPDAFAVVGVPCVMEVDVYVTDLKSRYTIQFDGPNGSVTDIQLGGADLDTEDSPGGLAVPTGNFSLLQTNPAFGGVFSVGPPQFFWDTGNAVPLQAWFRLQITVVDGGTYTVAMDASGTPGGDLVFEVPIDTGSGNEVNGASPDAGESITVGADAIDGFDTNTGLDEGGNGVFLRDPITFTQDDTTLPGALDPGFGAPPTIVPGDFCYYTIDAVDGADFQGNLPVPCLGTLTIGGVVGLARNPALTNWPNGGNPDICPESLDFIWNDEPITGTCTGQWTFIDPDNPANNSDWPINLSEVDSWGRYLLADGLTSGIPAFTFNPEASTWYFDNISLSGSLTE